MSTDTVTELRFQREATFFDAVASRAPIQRLSQEVLERYRRCPHANLFSKEFMFSLLKPAAGLKILEVGCGEGAASLQLAACGAGVTGIDLSAKSIDVARQRAKINEIEVDFRQANLETDDLGTSEFDVVWCDNILHHVVPALPIVLAKLHRTLKPGGLFIAREPVVYASILKSIRRLVPVAQDATPDEQPLGDAEFAVLHDIFPELRQRQFRILARADRVTSSPFVLRMLARVDNVLLTLPFTKRLAGHVVMWARRWDDARSLSN